MDVFLEQTEETTPPISPEWRAYTEWCTQYDASCEHRQIYGSDCIVLDDDVTITRIE